MRMMICAAAVMIGTGMGCTPSSKSSNSSNTSTGGSTPSAMTAPSTNYVLTKDAQYYKNSPAQPMPPDGTWREGTKVTLVKSMGNYKLVESSDGTKAYVASDALGPAAK